ncbi:MAG: helix-turn-helix domain-containing protein [Actinobacteria bacterium]|nr:helix-turn-helix domain-containing protein [Actinomycetota bacterium]
MEGSHLRAVLPAHEPEGSLLAAARLRRRMTVEEAAARAGLSVEDVRCLEESRIYRFPSVDRALAAALVYGNALGVSGREARKLAGLSAGPRAGWRLRRWLAIVAFAASLASLG